jgi:hypothetical protein
MTNLEALQSIVGVNYPFGINTYNKALIDQGLNPSDDYSLSNSKSIDLAFAGVLITVITSVDIKEGGYQVTNADRDALIKVLNGIYNKYGMPPFTATPVLQAVYNKW